MAAYEIFPTIVGGYAYGRLWPPIASYGPPMAADMAKNQGDYRCLIITEPFLFQKNQF